jgi:cytochrome P450
MDSSANRSAPAHVPLERIVDVDVYDLPGADHDFLAAWKRIQNAARCSLVWTPRNDGHWIALRGRDIACIYADHDVFSSRIVLVPAAVAERFQITPTNLDPPEHTPYRRRLSAAFASHAIESEASALQALMAEPIERVRLRGCCDFVAEVAAALPARVFMHLAGLPPADADQLPGYAAPIVGGAEAEPRLMERFADYIRPHALARLQRPSADLLGRLLSPAKGEAPMSAERAVDMATTVLTGGIDTVVSTLSLAMLYLARQPVRRAELATQPHRVRPAVAELLRRHPIMTKARLVLADRAIDGVMLRAGDVVVLPPLHGLDDAEFADALAVDFDRPAAPNLAFGLGVHRCPAAGLARLELELAIVEWLRRIPEFELDPAAPPRMKGGVLGALLALPLRWDPARTVDVNA